MQCSLPPPGHASGPRQQPAGARCRQSGPQWPSSAWCRASQSSPSRTATSEAEVPPNAPIHRWRFGYSRTSAIGVASGSKIVVDANFRSKADGRPAALRSRRKTINKANSRASPPAASASSRRRPERSLGFGSAAPLMPWGGGGAGGCGMLMVVRCQMSGVRCQAGEARWRGRRRRGAGAGTLRSDICSGTAFASSRPAGGRPPTPARRRATSASIAGTCRHR